MGLVSSGSSHFTRFEREPPGSGTANTMEEDATKTPLKPVGRFARLHGLMFQYLSNSGPWMRLGSEQSQAAS